MMLCCLAAEFEPDSALGPDDVELFCLGLRQWTGSIEIMKFSTHCSNRSECNLRVHSMESVNVLSTFSGFLGQCNAVSHMFLFTMDV